MSAQEKFGIVSREDAVFIEYAKVLPKERRAVILDNTLHIGARLMWVYVTDCSVWPGHNVRPGIIRFSDAELAGKFDCSVETIRIWKRQLRERGRIWTVDRWMKNTWPKTQYQITAICGQQPLPLGNDDEEGDHPADETETLSNRRRRQGPMARDGLGQFSTTRPKCASCRQGHLSEVDGKLTCDFCKHPTPKIPKRSKTHETPANTEPNEIILPPSPVVDYRPLRYPATAENGSPLPPTPVVDDRPRPLDTPPVGGSALPPTAVNGNRPGRYKTTVNGETQKRGSESFRGVREGTAPPDSMSIWIKTLDRMFPSQLKTVRAELEMEVKKAKSAEAKKALRAKLAIVKEKLFGPPVPDEPEKRNPTEAEIALEAQRTRQPTAEELAESERFLAERKGVAV